MATRRTEPARSPPGTNGGIGVLSGPHFTQATFLTWLADKRRRPKGWTDLTRALVEWRQEREESAPTIEMMKTLETAATKETDFWDRLNEAAKAAQTPGDVADVQQKLSAARVEIQSIQRAHEATKDQLAMSKEAASVLEGKLRTTEAELNRAKRDLDAAKTESGRMKDARDLRAEEVRNLTSTLESVRKELAVANGELQKAGERDERLRAGLKSRDAELAKMAEELRDAREEAAAANAEFQSARRELEQARKAAPGPPTPAKPVTPPTPTPARVPTPTVVPPAKPAAPPTPTPTPARVPTPPVEPERPTPTPTVVPPVVQPTLAPGEIAAPSPFKTFKPADLRTAIGYAKDAVPVIADNPNVKTDIAVKPLTTVGRANEAIGVIDTLRETIRTGNITSAKRGVTDAQDRVIAGLRELLQTTYIDAGSQFADRKDWPTGQPDKRPRIISEIVKNVIDASVGVGFERVDLTALTPYSARLTTGGRVNAFTDVAGGRSLRRELDELIGALQGISGPSAVLKKQINVVIDMRNIVASMVVASGRPQAHVSTEFPDDLGTVVAPLRTGAPKPLSMDDAEDVFDWEATSI